MSQYNFIICIMLIFNKYFCVFFSGYFDNYDDKEDDMELCRIKDILLFEIY